MMNEPCRRRAIWAQRAAQEQSTPLAEAAPTMDEILPPIPANATAEVGIGGSVQYKAGRPSALVWSSAADPGSIPSSFAPTEEKKTPPKRKPGRPRKNGNVQ